jgi:hypothetical protein
MVQKIETLKNVEEFAAALVAEGLSFHPDDDFKDYINLKTGEPYYSTEDAELRNKLMQQCFEICEKEGADIYNCMLEVFLQETGMDKYIPLPSEVISKPWQYQ